MKIPTPVVFLLHWLAIGLAIGCSDEGNVATGVGGAGGTGGAGGQGGGGVAADRAYNRLVDGFESEEACLQATDGTGFNCNNELVLCKNAGFVLILTDVISEGRCEPSGGSLSCTVLGPGDLPEGTVLTVTPGVATVDIPEIAGEHPWVERELDAPGAAAIAESCDALTGRLWW
jgi:hypothetical protein